MASTTNSNTYAVIGFLVLTIRKCTGALQARHQVRKRRDIGWQWLTDQRVPHKLATPQLESPVH